MLGACATFVSCLIGKSRMAGILGSQLISASETDRPSGGDEPVTGGEVRVGESSAIL